MDILFNLAFNSRVINFAWFLIILSTIFSCRQHSASIKNLPESRDEIITKLVLKEDNVAAMEHVLDSISKGKRHLKVFILENKTPNVEVGEMFANGSKNIYFYFSVNPATKEVSQIQY